MHVLLKKPPHDLSKLFDKAGINRWSVLNKHMLAAKEQRRLKMTLSPLAQVVQLEYLSSEGPRQLIAQNLQQR